jgi:hypothetical protein
VDKAYPGPCSSWPLVLHSSDKLGLPRRACSSRPDLTVTHKAPRITRPDLNAACPCSSRPTSSPNRLAAARPCSNAGHLPSRSLAQPPGSVFGEPAKCAARCLCAWAALHRSDVSDQPATTLGLHPCPRCKPGPPSPVKLVLHSTARTLQTGRPPRPASACPQRQPQPPSPMPGQPISAQVPPSIYDS